MNAPHDLQPEPCRFVASTDDPATPTGRTLWPLVRDLTVAVAALALVGWWALGHLGL